MKISIFSVVLAITLLVSSGENLVYGKTNPKTSDYATATISSTVQKKLEQVFYKIKQKQKNDKLQMGSLVAYQNKLVKEIEQQHPNYTKIINLGEVPYSLTDCSSIEKTGASATSAKHYLLKVQEENEVFYYGVSVVSVFYATSDVIPAHLSKIVIFVKPVKETELTELLKN